MPVIPRTNGETVLRSGRSKRNRLKFFVSTKSNDPDSKERSDESYEQIMDQCRRYREHLQKITPHLPREFLEFLQAVHLGDAKLKSLSVDLEKKTVNLHMLAEIREDGPLTQISADAIVLTYSGVRLVQNVLHEDQGGGELPGFGDLLNDEIDISEDGLYEHRMIFSSGIELSLLFSEFSWGMQGNNEGS